MKDNKQIIVIGGGAAGFFAAIQASDQGRNKVILLEKTNKLLSKVKVSGGGRCNVTHDCEYANKLINHYPRGGRSLRKGFEIFGTRDTQAWFEERGVQLKAESDGRMFPITDDSQTIIDCLFREVQKCKIDIRLKSEVELLSKSGQGFELKLKGGQTIRAEKVILATGGSPKEASYQWIKDMNIKVASPLPSLFTFNVPDSDIKELKGLSVKQGEVKLPGTKWKQEGPILITHWGFSGPGVIKLSAWAAVELHKKSYQFPILINWTTFSEDEVKQHLQDFKSGSPKKKVTGHSLFDIPSRLWMAICKKAGINEEQRYLDLPKKNFNKLAEHLVRDPYQVNGKTTFKEEFVTCGGVELDEVNLKAFELKSIPGLYVIGELLNVDGVTGGFNFQHAWTSGYLAGSHASKTLNDE